MKKNRRAQARVYFPKNRYNRAATWKQVRYISTETCLKFKRRRPSVPFSLETSWVENIHSFSFKVKPIFLPGLDCDCVPASCLHLHVLEVNFAEETARFKRDDNLLYHTFPGGVCQHEKLFLFCNFTHSEVLC